MTDQHSKHVLGAYGNDLVRTPNLDRLASQGVRFDSAYCPAPLCVPSRMSFMTSRLASRNRALDNSAMLSSSIPTWATSLTIAGYETALIGRMHFQGPDQHHGFEKRVCGEFSAGYPGGKTLGGPGFTVFPRSTTGQSRIAAEIAGRGIGSYQWMDREVTERACSYLMNRGADGDERPFAAVVGYLLPHCPFVGEAELFDYYYDRVEIPSIEDNQPETIVRFRRDRDILDPPLDEERIRVAKAAYYAMCESIDRMIGQVLDALEKSGNAENTVVVYTSDHGEMIGDHGCFWKSSYYEGSVGVPMIVRYPGMAPEDVSTDGIVNLYDLGPTFCDIAATDEMPLVDGRSILPLFQRPLETAEYRQTISEFVDFRGPSGPRSSRMLRSGRWKYWRYFDEERLPPVLFDLETDPGEINNLAGSSEYEETIRELDTTMAENWDPVEAARIASEEAIGFRQISEWGRIVQPDSPYRMPMPPPQFEENAELR